LAQGCVTTNSLVGILGLDCYRGDIDQERYAVMNKARSQINKLSSAINDIKASDKYNTEQKREQLNVLVEARNNLIRELYENGYLIVGV